MKNLSIALVFMASSMVGCAALGGDRSTPENLDEFNRTTSCVRRGLPMEVIFSIPDNPPHLAGDHVASEDIDEFVRKMDGKLRLLLQSSIRKALKKSGLQRTGSLEVDRYFGSLAQELSSAIADDGPRAFGVEFCGAAASVSNAVSADIAGYFERALLSEQGNYAGWATRIAGAGNESSLLLVMVALRADGLGFSSRAQDASLVNDQKH